MITDITGTEAEPERKCFMFQEKYDIITKYLIFYYAMPGSWQNERKHEKRKK